MSAARAIAVVGAGPAGLYAAEKLAAGGHEVTVLNRDIRPGGLAEHGIYPDKLKMKDGLRKVFLRTLASPKVAYLGDVTVGADGPLRLEELRTLGFDAVLVTVGAQGTRSLGLPGEELAGVLHAKDVVYHYNALPPFSERKLTLGRRVAIVGMGNVCVDVAHWLLSAGLADEVTATSRHGPGQRVYTDKEIKAVSAALDRDALRLEVQRTAEPIRTLGGDPDTLLAEVLAEAEAKGTAEVAAPSTSMRLRLRYFVGPARIIGQGGRVTGLELDHLRAELGTENWHPVYPTGVREVLPVDTVIFAIGDRVDERFGLPLDPEGRAFATCPEPWAAQPSRPRYRAYDPKAKAALDAIFLAGWARRASDGLVGKARQDALFACDELLAYLAGEMDRPAGPPTDPTLPRKRLLETLRTRWVEPVDAAGVTRLLSHEKALAAAQGKPEVRLAQRAAILSALGR